LTLKPTSSTTRTRFCAKEEQAFCVGTGEAAYRHLYVKGRRCRSNNCSATDIKADELIDHDLLLSSDGIKKNAVFVLASTTLAGIRKLKDGNGVYMWQPSAAG
jgi:HK97 family phage major capsid protein